MPYIVTLDEMYLSANDITGKRNGCYEKKGKEAPNEYKKKERSGWLPKILFAIGVCHRGSTSLRIVPEIYKIRRIIKAFSVDLIVEELGLQIEHFSL